MRRIWFQDADGTYYRNGPLILAEMREAIGHERRFRKLEAEMAVVRRDGLIRKPALGRGDQLGQPLSMREAYPDKPGLWILDEPGFGVVR